jgi:uncharacterized protein YcbK (DUF882 family)
MGTMMTLWLMPVTAAFMVPTYSLTGDGVIRLENIHTGKVLDVQYRDEYWYDFDALEKINEFLKCRKTGLVTSIDLRLVNLIDHLQDHFKSETVQVISGFRSPKLNNQLRRHSRRVAKFSFHMKGQAMDVRLSGISTHRLKTYGKTLKAGGVGYYPGSAFVHMDTGPVRHW